MPTILAIESTCDETGAAVVMDGRDVRSNIVASQVDLHAKYFSESGVSAEVLGRQDGVIVAAGVRRHEPGSLIAKKFR